MKVRFTVTKSNNRMSAQGTQESSTTGSFPVVQFDSSQKPYVAVNLVHRADIHGRNLTVGCESLEDLSTPTV